MKKLKKVDMGIPININRSHLLQALEEINFEGVPLDKKVRKFCLMDKDKCYPLKYVISIAKNIQIKENYQ